MFEARSLRTLSWVNTALVLRTFSELDSCHITHPIETHRSKRYLRIPSKHIETNVIYASHRNTSKQTFVFVLQHQHILRGYFVVLFPIGTISSGYFDGALLSRAILSLSILSRAILFRAILSRAILSRAILE